MTKKSNLYIFGDSYSNDWKTVESFKQYGLTGQCEYVLKYFKSNNEYPLHFEDVLKTHFNCSNVFNYAIGGLDNYTILELVGKHINEIDEDDIVVIGWSDISRWRFIDNSEWRILLSNTPKEWEYYSDEFGKQVLKRDSKLIMDEIRHWQNILLKGLPKNTIFWSPFIYDEEEHPYKPFVTPHVMGMYVENIFEKTNGNVEDYHYSENGMKTIGKWMIEIFNNNPYRTKKWL